MMISKGIEIHNGKRILLLRACFKNVKIIEMRVKEVIKTKTKGMRATIRALARIFSENTMF